MPNNICIEWDVRVMRTQTCHQVGPMSSDVGPVSARIMYAPPSARTYLLDEIRTLMEGCNGNIGPVVQGPFGLDWTTKTTFLRICSK